MIQFELLFVSKYRQPNPDIKFIVILVAKFIENTLKLIFRIDIRNKRQKKIQGRTEEGERKPPPLKNQDRKFRKICPKLVKKQHFKRVEFLNFLLFNLKKKLYQLVQPTSRSTKLSFLPFPSTKTSLWYLRAETQCVIIEKTVFFS